jgi:hypothetical protein
VLVHRLQEPDAHARAALLAQTGHGYMGYLRTLTGLCIVLIGAALVGRVVAGFRNRTPGLLPSWWWAALPAAAFLIQEWLGELAQVGAVEWSPLLEPVMAAGVAVELVCGALCLLLVRRLLVAAHSVGRSLAAAVERRAPLAALSLELRSPQLERPRLLALVGGGGERAPPPFG